MASTASTLRKGRAMHSTSRASKSHSHLTYTRSLRWSYPTLDRQASLMNLICLQSSYTTTPKNLNSFSTSCLLLPDRGSRSEACPGLCGRDCQTLCPGLALRKADPQVAVSGTLRFKRRPSAALLYADCPYITARSGATERLQIWLRPQSWLGRLLFGGFMLEATHARQPPPLPHGFSRALAVDENACSRVHLRHARSHD
jgi:hypothetical protein